MNSFRRPLWVAQCALLSAASVVACASFVGCAVINSDNEAIVRVEAARNTGRASRLTLLGVKAMEAGNIDRAVAKLLAAIEADEAYGPAHNNLGLLHYEQGNLYQAVLAFEQAVDLMPGNPIVYYNLGLTLETAGKVHEALDLYWQAVEMDPVNPHFLGNLVRLRVKMGEDGPEVVTQLQDLILIETRPDWRRWADQELALYLNDALDRGPETPEFNTAGERRERTERSLEDKIIDLSANDSEPSDDDDELLLDSARQYDNEPSVPSRPLPMMESEGTVEQLPQGIERLLSPATGDQDP